MGPAKLSARRLEAGLLGRRRDLKRAFFLDGTMGG